MTKAMNQKQRTRKRHEKASARQSQRNGTRTGTAKRTNAQRSQGKRTLDRVPRTPRPGTAVTNEKQIKLGRFFAKYNNVVYEAEMLKDRTVRVRNGRKVETFPTLGAFGRALTGSWTPTVSKGRFYYLPVKGKRAA